MKFDKKTKVALLVGIPLLIGGYLIYKYMRGSNTNPSSPSPPSPNPPSPSPPSPAPSGCKSYTVVTKSTNLNIRQSPTTSSAIAGSLPKGSVVNAKPSSTSGWMELCDRAGYVSSQYLG
jgi:uncharacterized protein YgiM (DUF1202 family)